MASLEALHVGTDEKQFVEPAWRDLVGTMKHVRRLEFALALLLPQLLACSRDDCGLPAHVVYTCPDASSDGGFCPHDTADRGTSRRRTPASP